MFTSYNLFQLAFIRKIAKRRSNISLYADELGRGFVGELDYNIEAANATKFMVLFFLSLTCAFANLYDPVRFGILANNFNSCRRFIPDILSC